jgi:hypothetical protein
MDKPAVDRVWLDEWAGHSHLVSTVGVLSLAGYPYSRKDGHRATHGALS